MHPNFRYFDQNCQMQTLHLNQTLTPSEMSIKLADGRIIQLFIKNNPWISNGGLIIFKHCTVCGDQLDLNLVRPGGILGSNVCSKTESCRKIVLEYSSHVPHRFYTFVVVAIAHDLPKLEFHDPDILIS
jgi:hypothetical protein